ncbi:MAG: ion channel [Hyalangium sp.]|uniref:ion channel n=1 Tax=Hyalangium sp. TaxID=2028555 RepID=UPI00389B11C8
MKVTIPGAGYQIKVVGHRPTPLRDFYHALLQMPWRWTFVVISAFYLVANAAFALGYLATGGISHAAPGSFADAFFFSVQTMGTIGYGAMYPETRVANVLVVTESLVGLLLTALATGLVFAKFSLSRARIMFTRTAVISPSNGVPTLMFRFGNERGNQIVNAQIHLVLMRTERTAEGGTFYRSYDLKLVRDKALSLSRSWSAMHVIDRNSPLHGQTPESVQAQEVEIHVMVLGTDDTTMQAIHASHRYFTNDIHWGMRFADVLSETDDGNMLLDLSKFHDTLPTEPTTDFPYPRAS